MNKSQLKALAMRIDQVFGSDPEFSGDWAYYRDDYEIGSALEFIEDMAEDQRGWKLRYRRCLLKAGALLEIPEGEETRMAHSSFRGRIKNEFRIKGKRYEEGDWTFHALDQVSERRVAIP